MLTEKELFSRNKNKTRDDVQASSSPNKTALSDDSAGSQNLKGDNEKTIQGVDSRVGAFPSDMPRLRGIQKNSKEFRVGERIPQQQISASSPTNSSPVSENFNKGHDHETNGVTTRKEEEEESRAGAFPSQMPRLRGLQKNREDALEALRVGNRSSPNNATSAVAVDNQQQNQPSPQRTNESSDNHRKQQKNTLKEQEKEQSDIMDIVRKLAIRANNEETEFNHEEAVSMPQPPPFGGSEHHHCDHAPPLPSDNSGPHTIAAAPGEGLHRRDDNQFLHVGIHSPFPVGVKESTKRQRKYYLVLACVFVCIVAGVILGVVFRNNNNNNNNKDPRRTPTPTLAPSTTTPTGFPSSAPSDVLGYLMESVPELTRESLGTFGTPQYKARDWLLNHPNITNLEEWRKKQLFALATFYYSFEGDNWSQRIRERWMDNEKEECHWFSSGSLYQPSCNDDGEFVSLKLRNLQLSGFNPTMPPEIALLTSLSSIILNWNDINGPLSNIMPAELGQLTNLTSIVLWRNELAGPVPSEVGLITSLKELDLVNNALTGQLPSELGLMTSMTRLILDDNGFNGQLPRQLGLMTSLTELQLHDNTLSGSIPSQVALLTNLEHLRLQNNALTGPLPPAMESLGVNGTLIRLTLGNNSLSGTIPGGLCSLGVLDWRVGKGLSFDCSDLLCGCCWCPCQDKDHINSCQRNLIHGSSL